MVKFNFSFNLNLNQIKIFDFFRQEVKDQSHTRPDIDLTLFSIEKVSLLFSDLRVCIIHKKCLLSMAWLA